MSSSAQLVAGAALGMVCMLVAAAIGWIVRTISSHEKAIAVLIAQGQLDGRPVRDLVAQHAAQLAVIEAVHLRGSSP